MTVPNSKLRFLPTLGPETRPTRSAPQPPQSIKSPSSEELKQERLITLPTVLLYKILAELGPQDLSQICQANSQLNQICKDKHFWKFKHTESFGHLPPKPDQRVVFYQGQRALIRNSIAGLVNKSRKENIDLILSALKVAPPYRLVDRYIEEEFDESEFEFDVIQLGKDVSFLAFESSGMPADETYQDFENRMLCFIRPQASGRPRTRGPVRVMQNIVYQYFVSQLNPNAKLFEKYPLSDFNNDPVLALIKAIYDNSIRYGTHIDKLEDELTKIDEFMARLIEHVDAYQEPY